MEVRDLRRRYFLEFILLKVEVVFKGNLEVLVELFGCNISSVGSVWFRICV